MLLCPRSPEARICQLGGKNKVWEKNHRCQPVIVLPRAAVNNYVRANCARQTSGHHLVAIRYPRLKSSLFALNLSSMPAPTYFRSPSSARLGPVSNPTATSPAMGVGPGGTSVELPILCLTV